jgi:hypothetical protein
MSTGRKRGGAVATKVLLKNLTKEVRINNSDFPSASAFLKNTRTVKPSAEGFDPRFANPTFQSARKGDIPILEDLEFTKEKKIIEPPAFNPVDAEGRYIISTQSDRSAAGTTITHINGEALDEPITLQGGQDYMMENDAVWASNKGPVDGIMKMSNDAFAQTGKNPFFIPHTMAPTGTDFATMMPELMIKVARQRLSKADIAEINKFIRGSQRKIDKKMVGFEEFVGIEHPDAVKQLSSVVGDKRKKLIADLDKFRGMGGISSPEARLIISDPAQYGAVDGQLRNVGEVHAGKSPQQTFSHDTYPWEVPGEAQGRIIHKGNRPMDSFDLIQEGKEIGNKKTGWKKWHRPEKITQKEMRGMSMNHSMQMNFVDDKLLRQWDDRGLLSPQESKAVSQIMKERGSITLPELAGLGVLSTGALAGITALLKENNKPEVGEGTVLRDE